MSFIIKIEAAIRQLFDGVFLGNVDPLYAHPTYCPSAILPIRPTATSDLRQL